MPNNVLNILKGFTHLLQRGYMPGPDNVIRLFQMLTEPQTGYKST